MYAQFLDDVTACPRGSLYCVTTRILQFVVDVFADVVSMFSVPFTLTLLLLKHLNSPTFIAFLCMFCLNLMLASLPLFVI